MQYTIVLQIIYNENIKCHILVNISKNINYMYRNRISFILEGRKGDFRRIFLWIYNIKFDLLKVFLYTRIDKLYQIGGDRYE